MNTGGYIVSKCFKKTKFIRSREKKENFETIQSIKIFQNCQLVAASIERIFLPSDIRIHLRGTISPGYRIGTSHRDKRIWTARATRKHGGRRRKKIGRGGGEVELRGQTKNRVTTIIAVPGRKVSSLSLSLCVRCNGRPTRMPTRPGRGNAARRRTGKGVRSRRCAEGVCRANTRGGRQLGLFRHGGARAVVCPAKQDIITGGVHSRRDTSSDLLPDGFLVSLLETNKREACYEASRSS